MALDPHTESCHPPNIGTFLDSGLNYDIYQDDAGADGYTKFWPYLIGNSYTLLNNTGTTFPVWKDLTEQQLVGLALHELMHIAEGMNFAGDHDNRGDMADPYHMNIGSHNLSTDPFERYFANKIKDAG